MLHLAVGDLGHSRDHHAEDEEAAGGLGENGDVELAEERQGDSGKSARAEDLADCLLYTSSDLGRQWGHGPFRPHSRPPCDAALAAGPGGRQPIEEEIIDYMEGNQMDFNQIKSAAAGYSADMNRFLRAMISHPSESCEEKDVVMCIKAEMEKLGYDKVEIDGLGNVIGWMGDGEKIIAIDSHIDTVGVGNIDNWTHEDVYKRQVEP